MIRQILFIAIGLPSLLTSAERVWAGRGPGNGGGGNIVICPGKPALTETAFQGAEAQIFEADLREPGEGPYDLPDGCIRIPSPVKVDCSYEERRQIRSVLRARGHKMVNCRIVEPELNRNDEFLIRTDEANSKYILIYVPEMRHPVEPADDVNSI